MYCTKKSSNNRRKRILHQHQFSYHPKGWCSYVAGDEGYRLKPPPLASKMCEHLFVRYATPNPANNFALAKLNSGLHAHSQIMKNARPKGLTIFMAGAQ